MGQTIWTLVLENWVDLDQLVDLDDLVLEIWVDWMDHVICDLHGA